MLRDEIREHLTQCIIPFWERMKDGEYGGFYGYMGYDLELDKRAVKGCILNSRILWFFSNAYMLLGDKELLSYAKHSFEFLKDHCIDRKYGGVYWSVTYDGQPCETIKHTYNQAFAIYALSSYYRASGDKEALEIADKLFDLIESVCRDDKGYLESFTEDFNPEDNEKLSENGVTAARTMNTLLHVFEAYTEFYAASGLEKAGRCMRQILDIFAEKVYDPDKKRQEVFFDEDWNSLIDLHSFGHDIETAWLVDRGCEILGDVGYTEKMRPITKALEECVFEKAYHNCSLANEAESGTVDTTRVWWIQAEAMVGYMNAYQKYPEHKEYLDAVGDIWDFIKKYIIDKRGGSEWFWCVDESGAPTDGKPIADPWKCPYHNGRMCIEIIRRTENAS